MAKAAFGFRDPKASMRISEKRRRPNGEGNGLVINAAAEPAFVAETIGNVKQLSGSSYDLGPEDGINLVIIKP